MLDISDGAEEQLKKITIISGVFDELFHPGIISGHHDVFIAGQSRSFKDVYDTARSTIAKIIGNRDVPPINFNGHDIAGSQLFQAFCMANPGITDEWISKIAGYCSRVFSAFSTDDDLTDIFCNVLDTDYPEGWVPNIWYSNGINGVLDDMKTPRVFFDLDDTLLFHGNIAGPEEPMVAKVIRPDALQLVQEIKSLGVKVGLYTGATAPYTCRSLRADIPHYDFYEVKGGVPVRVERDYAAKILAEIIGCMDFAIPRASYAQLCPYEAFVTRGRLCPAGARRQRTLKHYLLNLKVIPGVGHPMSVLLDDRAAKVRSARGSLATRTEVAKMSYVGSPPVAGVEIVNTHLEVYLEAVAALESEIRKSNERLMRAVKRLVA